MLKYRKARKSDFEFLPEIERSAGKIFADFGMPSLAKDSPLPIQFYHSLPDTSVVFVAEDENDVIGFIIVMQEDGHAYIREMSVYYSYGKQGIGSSLLKNAENWAAEQGYDYMTLTTFKELPFNGVFYKKRGYEAFQPTDDWPYLQYVRKMEFEKGIDILPRVAMRKAL